MFQYAPGRVKTCLPREISVIRIASELQRDKKIKISSARTQKKQPHSGKSLAVRSENNLKKADYKYITVIPMDGCTNGA